VKWGRAIAKLILTVALLALASKAQFRADTILSVLRSNDVVFVSTRTGLFQSTVSRQKWTAVKLPKGVLPGGCLNASDPGVTKIYYSPPATALTDRQRSLRGWLWIVDVRGFREDLEKSRRNALVQERPREERRSLVCIGASPHR
jgi:hypothetical protein